jgi:DNA-binding LacI/PurR family transcriptional regulator/DNA-binding transcriptional regulator YhcF (GntR family)
LYQILFFDIFLNIMKKRKPGIEKALAYIDQNVSLQKFQSKLPSIRHLADKAGVSYVTMWRSVNLFVRQKKSDKNEGRPTLETQPDLKLRDNDNLNRDSRLAYDNFENLLWQKVKNRLKKDILSGGYPSGQTLPSYKELQDRYGVSFCTLKKSLNGLVTEDIIKPCKKRFMVPAITVSESNARVVALGCGWEDGRIWADFQDKNYFRILESECIQSKISLDLIVYYKGNSGLRFIHSGTGKSYDLENGNILGIIYIIANLQVNPQEILKKLSLLRKPVAVLDVIGCLDPSTDTFDHRLMKYFTTTASPFPAKTVAKYLLNLQHTKIAFISPFHNAPWSKIRLNSCAAIFQDAGFPEGVEPFVLNRYAYQWDYLHDSGKQDDMRSFINHYTQWEKNAFPGFSEKFRTLRYGLSKYFTEWNCAGGEIYTMMRPLFKKAFHNRSITAWVMANDFAATLAIDYLKEINCQTPEDISIVSFDNTIDAMEYQITSYDFNNNGIVTMMLRYILSPPSLPMRGRDEIMEVEGRIVVRRSTGLARITVA